MAFVSASAICAARNLPGSSIGGVSRSAPGTPDFDAGNGPPFQSAGCLVHHLQQLNLQNHGIGSGGSCGEKRSWVSWGI